MRSSKVLEDRLAKHHYNGESADKFLTWCSESNVMISPLVRVDYCSMNASTATDDGKRRRRLDDGDCETKCKVDGEEETAKDNKLIVLGSKRKNIHCEQGNSICAQFGMIADQRIPMGTELFSIPRDSILTWQNSSIADIVRDEIEENSDFLKWMPILVCVMYEYMDVDSRWKPYFDLFPDFQYLDQPMFWPISERSSKLEGMNILELVNTDLETLNNDFETIITPFILKHSNIFFENCLNVEYYQKMVAFVMAYSFTEPKEEEVVSDNSDSDDDNDSDDEIIINNICPMMVPVADILNHVSNHNAEISFGEDMLTMKAIKDIEAGEEIFNTYGDHSNESLLQMYGFTEVDSSNPHSEIILSFDLLPIDYNDRVQYVKENYTEGFIINKDGIVTEGLDIIKILTIFTLPKEEYHKFIEHDDIDDSCSDSNIILFDYLQNFDYQYLEILKILAKSILRNIPNSIIYTDKDTNNRSLYSNIVRDDYNTLISKLLQFTK